MRRLRVHRSAGRLLRLWRPLLLLPTEPCPTTARLFQRRDGVTCLFRWGVGGILCMEDRDPSRRWPATIFGCTLQNRASGGRLLRVARRLLLVWGTRPCTCRTARLCMSSAGQKNLRWFNDMYALAIEDDAAAAEWTLVKSLGKSPTSAYHSCTVFRDELYVFGGVHGHQSARIPDTCSNTVHVFTPATSTWYEPLVTGTKPCPRSGHSATLVGEQLIIFGGWDSPTCFGDLFILDLVMMEFTQPQTSGSPPSPRSWHSAVALPDRKIVVSGGFDGENSLDDAHILDLDTMAWSALSPSSEIFRRPRAGHVTCLATSEVASGAPAVVVSGGGDNNDFFYPGAQTVPVSLVLS
eukprot:Opistho-2@67642